MKKLFALIAALALLLLAGCGEALPEETGEETTAITGSATDIAATEAQTDPAATKAYPPPKPPETVNTDYVFTSTYARTPTHFYAIVYMPATGGEGRQALYHMPLNDLSKAKELPLPRDLTDGDGWLEICGLTQKELFVGRERYASGGAAWYSIPLNTLQAEKLNISDAHNVWYNTASGSFIALTGDLYEAPRQMKAYRPDTGESSVIMDNVPSLSGMSEHWHNTADGMIALGGSSEGGEGLFVVVDKDDRASLTTAEEIQFRLNRLWQKEPQNKAEEALSKRESVQSYVSNGAWIYYVERVGEKNNLYRINTDGTGKKLLREGTNIWRLYAIDGKLYCTALDPTRVQEEQADDPVAAYLLNEEGKVEKVLFQDSSYDTGHAVLPFYGMAIVKSFHVYGGRDGYFGALYDPATDTLFQSYQ